MSIKDWHVGQSVVVHFPHANQGSIRQLDTEIVKLGRKYITVRGVQGEFDADLPIPRSGQEELYTPEGYQEKVYVTSVLLELDRNRSLSRIPAQVLIPIGDYLGIEKPEHLQPKQEINHVEEEPKPSSTHPRRPSYRRASKGQ
jgi:hypothetical protein